MSRTALFVGGPLDGRLHTLDDSIGATVRIPHLLPSLPWYDHAGIPAAEPTAIRELLYRHDPRLHPVGYPTFQVYRLDS